MTINPLDLHDDGFPHGTLEGERAGCVTRDCPAAPLTCTQIAQAYRTDFGFRKLYRDGVRGDDLKSQWDRGAALPQPTKRAKLDDDARDTIDAELIRRHEAGATLGELAEFLGYSAPAPKGRRLNAARRRANAATATRTPSVPTAKPSSSTALARVAETDERPTALFVSDQSHARLDDLEGPQVRQLWVVLNADKHIVMGCVDPAVAASALGDEWKRYIGTEATW